MRCAALVMSLGFVVILAACGTTPPGSSPPGNSPPSIVDRSVTTFEDTAVPITVIADDAEGEPLTYDYSAPGHGTVTASAAMITYLPDRDYHGPDAITVTVSDGASRGVATLSITVVSVNDNPVAVDDSLAAAKNTAATIQGTALTANDTDVDGDALSVTAVSAPSIGTATLAGSVVTYTPANDFTGTATFAYTTSDGNGGTDGGTVTVTVVGGGGNIPPVAVADSAITVEDTPLTIAGALLTANDTDANGQTLTVTGVSGAQNGTVGLIGGVVTFTPAANFNGTAHFDYTVSDGLDMAIGQVEVTVTPANDAPVVAAITPVTRAEDTAVTITLTGSDVEGDALTFGVSVGPVSGTLGVITQATPTSATVVYTPNANFNGNDSFSFATSDGTLTSASATAMIAVTPVNDVPVAVGGTVTTTEGQPVTLALAATDPDLPAMTLSFTISTPPGHGTVGAITPTGATSATVVYTPTGSYVGPDALQFVASDGSATSTPATVSITVSNAITCGNGQVDLPETCDDANTVPFDGCNASCQLEALFFSEYVEGNINNKAIEIANPFNVARDLTGCSLRLYLNGSATVSAQLPLTQTIASHDVLVVCHPSADAAILGRCDVLSSTVINFNGDDTIELFCNGVSIDTIGQRGFQPPNLAGGEWGIGLTSTRDNTLRRRCGFTVGDPINNDVFDPTLQWTGFAVDTFDGLGFYNCSP